MSCKYPLGRPVVPRSCTSHFAVYVSLYIENWYVYRYPPAHYGELPYRLTPEADSLVICSQNQFWYPKLLPPARSARMGAEKRILHPWRPKTASYSLTRRQKPPKRPKALLNHPARNGFWRPQVAAWRSDTAPRPIWPALTVGAPSGACGRTMHALTPPPLWL
jgi:hypothetical protein